MCTDGSFTGWGNVSTVRVSVNHSTRTLCMDKYYEDNLIPHIVCPKIPSLNFTIITFKPQLNIHDSGYDSPQFVLM